MQWMLIAGFLQQSKRGLTFLPTCRSLSTPSYFLKSINIEGNADKELALSSFTGTTLFCCLSSLAWAERQLPPKIPE